MTRLRTILLSIAMLAPGMAMAAPDISANFTRETGVAPFDSDNAPGNDSSAFNSVIRTNDVISYKFEIVVLNDDATNIVLRLSTGPGLELDLPAFCRETGVAPASSLSGDSITGYSIICNVGDISQGSQVLYTLPATVVPEQANGSAVSLLTASVESDQTVPDLFAGATDTVSASPKFDLIKDDHSRLLGRHSGPNGEDGVVYAFSLEVATRNQGKGNELVTAPLSFTDDLSGVSPNALLYEGWTGAYADACVPNQAGGFPRLWQNPRGNTQASDGGPGGSGSGPAENSVWNSGDIDCTLPGPGGTSTITIAGADLTGRHYPTKTANNGALPADTRYLVSGVLYVWIPLSDIEAAGGQLTVDNSYSSLSALSISGQANTEPNTSNNRRTFVAKDGAGSRSFYNHRDHDSYSLLDSQTNRRSGDGFVLPGQIFATRHYQSNQSWLTKTTFDNFSFCTSFDNSTQRITEITPGQGAKMTFDGTAEGDQPPFVIEYGTGAFGPTATCDDADSPSGWYTSMNLVPGGAAAITKVRSRGAYLAAPGGNSTVHRGNLIVRYTALDGPAGTIVSEFGTFKYDQVNSGNWILSTYDETTALGNNGDRLLLTKVAVRIAKDTLPVGQDQVLAGDSLSFRLQPSAITPGSPQQLTTDITITDTLPEWYQYTIGSASPPVSNFTNNPDGTTTLIWQLPDTVINDPMVPITYDVTVTPTTPDQTAGINSVVIHSGNDGSPEIQRSDSYSVLVLNPAGFSISKSAESVLVAPDNTFSYRLTFANTGTSDFANVQFIDILPNQTVSRSPPTEFDGSAKFVSVFGSNGETFEYTKADPTTIDEEPTAASNSSGGSTTWCPSFTGGACPANPAEVTAIRGISPAFLQGQPPRNVTIVMQGDDNDAFNTYSNRFVAKADGLAFSVVSPTATVYVRTADVSLTKSVDGPDSQYPDLVTFTLAASNDGPHTAEGVEITDLLPSGYAYYDHSGPGSYIPNTGIWMPPDIPVGGSSSMTIRAKVLPGGNYINTAEVTKQLYADPDSKPGNSGNAPNEDDSDTAAVTRLTGLIFLDNGIGGGSAHDRVQNGGEIGGRFGTLVFSDVATGTTQVSADIGADGVWSAVLATGLPGDFQAVFTPHPDYLLMSEGGGVLPALFNAAPRDGAFSFTPGLGTEHTGVNFGLVAKPFLSQSQIAAIAPGQIADLPHRFEATSDGSVSFALADQISTPPSSFASAIFADTDCDGTLDMPLAGPVPVAAGQSVCLVVRTQAASGVGAGATHLYGLRATTVFSGTGITHETRNDDQLDVGDGGGSTDQLVLEKFVRNVTAGTQEAKSNTGDLGDVLEYRLLVTNPGIGPANDVTINDATPAWTTLNAPIPASTRVAPGIICTLVVPESSSNMSGYAGGLEWSCPGAFPSGGKGELKFSVVISP